MATIGQEQALEALPTMIEVVTEDGGDVIVQLVSRGTEVMVEVVAPDDEDEPDAPNDSAAVTLSLDQARELHVALTALLLKAEAAGRN